jgi:2-hydroxychromene-2-carboxylate isomerase
MPAPIRFYFDFASPYAWFALPGITRLAVAHGRDIDFKPVLMWAILKEQGIAPPANSSAKWSYLLADMVRSADFYGVPYRHPRQLPLSSHRAARLYYAIEHADPGRARRFGESVLSAFFVEERDISDRDVLVELAGRHGLSSDTSREAMEGGYGRSRLAAAVVEAVADGVCGSPFFILDGEPFFGADRLPQIEWRLASRNAGPGGNRSGAAGAGW